MSTNRVYVFVDCGEKPHLVGQLWFRSNKGSHGASFQYKRAWLSHHERFALEPALQLTNGAYHTQSDRSIFGSIGDSAPDRWGRVLMRRFAASQARNSKKQTKTLTEMDYLLGVNDEARQGALRFSKDIEGPFLQNSNIFPVPPLVQLTKLLSATEGVIRDDASEADLKLLLAPGASLGGARPKASIRDKSGQLAIAKFPRQDDEYSTVLWEAVALSLAAHAGINVPEWHLESISGKFVILIKRFDRKITKRIPFLSAMSMIGAKDHEQHSYLEIVDALRQHGASPNQDMEELWRRIVFSILISNTDDHLRNHGFLYEKYKGWRLSPVYDINPTSTEISPRILTTTIDFNDGTASLELALSVASEFGLSQEKAKSIAKEVGQTVSKWREIAKLFQIKQTEVEQMSSAFEHNDLSQASRL